MNGKNGLTLIELVIALAVVSIITAGAALSFRLADRRVLYNTSLVLQADLRYAQRMSMIEGQRYGIEFDQRSYAIFKLAKNMPRTIIRTVELPDGVEYRIHNQPQVHYLPRGTITDGFTVVLEKGRYSQEITATVSGGRIEIKDMVFY